MDRVCAKCHERKPASEFYGSQRSWCKPCVRAYQRARTAARRPPKPSIPDGHKKCPACDQVLLLAEFRVRSNGRPYAYCRPCQRADNESRRQEKVRTNAEKVYHRSPKLAARGRPSILGPRGPLGSKWAQWRTSGVKTCPKCHATKRLAEFDRRKSDGRPHGWCRSCLRVAHDAWIKTPPGRAAQKRDMQKRWRTKNGAARRFTYAAIQLGILVRQPCEVCGAEKVHAHHTDYDKPLEVRWLCQQHHDAVHREESE